jgi:hypothetical protein
LLKLREREGERQQVPGEGIFAPIERVLLATVIPCLVFIVVVQDREARVISHTYSSARSMGIEAG